MLGDAFGTTVAGNRRFAALVEDRVATATANLIRAPAPSSHETNTDERDAGLALLGVGGVLAIAAIVLRLVQKRRRIVYAFAAVAVLLFAIGVGLSIAA